MSVDAAEAGRSGFAYRFEWGMEGLAGVVPDCDVVVVVDVLGFGTAVSAAVESGAIVIPFRHDGAPAVEYATSREAVLASAHAEGGPSPSPVDLLATPPGTRVVLPSPEGSTLALAAIDAGAPFVLAGSLRNATATARRALVLTGGRAPIGVLAAGEGWGAPDGPLRPAVEDLIGAGAILHALDPAGSVTAPRCSPEARAARAAFLDARPMLLDHLAGSRSGRQLVAGGRSDDVVVAAALDATSIAAQWVEDAFVAV